MELVSLADDFDWPGQRRTGAIRHRDAEFAGVGLTELTGGAAARARNGAWNILYRRGKLGRIVRRNVG